MAPQSRSAVATVTTLARPKDPFLGADEAMLSFEFDDEKPKALSFDAPGEEPSTLKEAIIRWLNERM